MCLSVLLPVGHINYSSIGYMAPDNIRVCGCLFHFVWVTLSTTMQAINIPPDYIRFAAVSILHINYETGCITPDCTRFVAVCFTSYGSH